jgi:hypothetical protein
MAFTKGFSKYACTGDTITCELDGFVASARIAHDEDAQAPWDREDGHGPVTDWVRRGKNAGERVLSQDRGSFRYYNFAEAVKIAKRDRWGYEGATGTPAQIAAEAAERDFKVLKAWCDDEWSYCGIVVSISREDVELGTASLWGIEYNYPGADNSYLTEVADELLPEAMDEARATLAQLCPCEGGN